MEFLDPTPTFFPTIQASRIPLPTGDYYSPQSQLVSENDGEVISDSQKHSVSLIKKLLKNRTQLSETPVKRVVKPRVRPTKPKNVTQERVAEFCFEDAPLMVLDKSRGKLDVAVMKCCAGKLVWVFEDKRMILKMCDRCVDLNRGYGRIMD